MGKLGKSTNFVLQGNLGKRLWDFKYLSLFTICLGLFVVSSREPYLVIFSIFDTFPSDEWTLRKASRIAESETFHHPVRSCVMPSRMFCISLS